MEKDVVIREDNYTGSINDRYTDGSIEGETAGKLLDFAEETARLLEKQTEPATKECAGKQINFISEIETEDQ